MLAYANEQDDFIPCVLDRFLHPRNSETNDIFVDSFVRLIGLLGQGNSQSDRAENTVSGELEEFFMPAAACSGSAAVSRS